MGIETVVTCDRCKKVLIDEDFTSISLKLETDINATLGTDIRKSASGIYCIPCGNHVWSILIDVKGTHDGA